MKKLHLGDGQTIHFIRKVRAKANSTMEAQKVVLEVKQLLVTWCRLVVVEDMRWYETLLKVIIAQAKPTEQNLYIKFSFDRASFGTKKKKWELGTLQLVNGKSLAELKSHKSAHWFIIYLGGEDYDTLSEELERTIPVIDSFSKGKKVNIIIFKKHLQFESFLLEV